MSQSRLLARLLAASGRGAQEDAATLERGLEALAFLERSRTLADEPVDPPEHTSPARPLDSAAV